MILQKEDYRNYSITKDGVDKVFMGEGINSYIKAIKYIRNQGGNHESR